jgi:FMN-dependent NADH-azoreductase
MTKLLHIVSSPRGEQSESTAIAATFLETYRREAPGVEVDTLDLWAGELPIYGGRGVAAKMSVFAGQEPAGEEGAAWDDVRAVFDRFAAADEYVFTVPMWNHGVPWVLKHLIDTISQPGLLFGFDPEAGYRGLLGGRRALAVYTSAVYADGRPPAFGSDFQRSYFHDWLRFAGIEDISEVRFRRNLVSTDADVRRVAAHALARATGRAWAQAPVSLAA